MDQLQLPQAKLLYYIAELFKNGDINENEKLKLKGEIDLHLSLTL